MLVQVLQSIRHVRRDSYLAGDKETRRVTSVVALAALRDDACATTSLKMSETISRSEGLNRLLSNTEDQQMSIHNPNRKGTTLLKRTKLRRRRNPSRHIELFCPQALVWVINPRPFHCRIPWTECTHPTKPKSQQAITLRGQLMLSLSASRKAPFVHNSIATITCRQ